jgi:flavin reductase (DIM6/NTAB) family NADH-FMN oxidoreductase RutF
MNEFVEVSNYTHLLHPYSTSLVTCCDKEGKPNIITIAWLVPISASPPLLGMSIRQTRFSYKLIKETGEFVINVAPFEIAKQVLYCGRKSGSQLEKFTETGLTPLPARKVRPPIIQECLAHIECRVTQDIEVGDHNLIVAQVLTAYANPTVLRDGLYDLSRAHLLLHLGGNRFTCPQAQTIELSLE